MNSCYACGQLVESRWQVCPYCSTPLNMQPNLQPTYAQQIPAQTYQAQPQYQTEYVTQVPPTPQYQNYPQQMIISPSSNPGKSIGIGFLIAILAVAFTVVLAGVLYVWASSLADDSSNYTWSGDLDSEFQNVRWYDSDGGWEKYTSSNNYESTDMSEMSDNFSRVDVQFSNSNLRMTYEAKQSSDFPDFTVDARHQLVGDVWFYQMTKVTMDGEVTNIDDGECIAVIHEDSYAGPSSWRNEVGSTNWPSWCDSVDDY